MNENFQVQEVPVATDKAPKNLRRVVAYAGAASTFVLTHSAFALEGDGALTVPDMAPIIALIMGMVALVASIGMAVLSVYATGKVFKWVKAAF